MIEYTDIVIVGAGPAGQCAALAAAGTGANVMIVSPGDQPSPADMWSAPREPFAHDRITRVAGQVVSMHRTDIGIDLLIAPDDGEELLTCAALSVVIANGAHDIALDFPGADLEGVLGARAALSTSLASLQGKRVVVVGSGQYVMATAAQLVSQGVNLAEVVSANQPGALGVARWRAHQWWRAGAKHRRIVRECGVSISYGQAVLAAQAGEDGRVAGVLVCPVDEHGQILPAHSRLIEADAVIVSHGQVAAFEFAAELGLPLVDDEDGLPIVKTDQFGRTDLPAVMAAGDVAGAAGRRGAEVSGTLAGWAAAVPVFGIATKLGKARDVNRLAALNQRLHKAAIALGSAMPLVCAEGVEPVFANEVRMLPTTLDALAQLDVPDRDKVLEEKETRLAEHFELAAGEPVLSSVIFDEA